MFQSLLGGDWKTWRRILMKHVKIGLGVLAMLLMIGPARAVQVPGPLVETEWLAGHLDEVVILDVRKDTKSFAAEPAFVKDKKTGKVLLARVGGHIPGAVLVDYRDVRAKRTIDGRVVTRMLPEKADFEKVMRAAGVNKDSAVVVVTKGANDGDMTIATRMYWQIKYYGHDNLAILNGGTAQWLTEGRSATDAASGKPDEGNWEAAAERADILATSEEVQKAVTDGTAQLVDNRPLSQYLGTARRSYVYAAGHIPGAKVYPTELMTHRAGPAKFLPADQLRQLHEGLNIKSDAQTITYCNSGHLASGGWFIMSELMGNKNVKLYDGSMHQWTLEERPVTSMKME
jgi:thiosulfate/3-mercaptopyruvate sulfurtransferase